MPPLPLSGNQPPLFSESTFIDQTNPKRQTAGPRWGSPKLGLWRHSALLAHASLSVPVHTASPTERREQCQCACQLPVVCEL